jgi:hypothetical protein
LRYIVSDGRDGLSEHSESNTTPLGICVRKCAGGTFIVVVNRRAAVAG